VVVTAQRREEKLQDVPIAVTAIRGDALIHSNVVKTANDVVQYVPGASASATDGRTRPRWFLRGIGTNETAASTVSPIGIYNDDVYLNNVYIQGFPLFDLDRVEVLPGPQGTLWGKNTTGGAIHFISKKPAFDADGYAQAGYGSFQEQSYQGAVGGPVLGETVAARLSFYLENRQGWVYNQATQRKEGAVFDSAARAQVLISPGHDFEALFIAKLRREDGDKSPSFSVLDPTQTLKNPLYAPASTGADAVASAGQNQEVLDSDGGSLHLNWYRGGYGVTSISAFERGKRVLFTGSAIAVDVGDSRAFSFSRQFSEELRVASPPTDRINWIAGIYLFRENLSTDSVTRNSPVPGAGGASPTSTSPFAFNYTAYDQVTTSVAPFASATARLLDKLSVTGGLRSSFERKTYDLTYIEAPSTAGFNSNVTQWWLSDAVTSLKEPQLSSAAHTWSRVTYDGTLQFKATKELNAYLHYAHGFRAGGFVVSADNTITQLNPETLNDTELGVKSQWFGGKLTVNAALFNYDYKDIIVGVLLPVPGTTTTKQIQENAATGYSRGGDLQVGYALGSLRVLGALEVLRTRYSNYFSMASGQTIDATGNHFTRAPTFSTTLDVEYAAPLPNGDGIGAGTDWSYRSTQYFNAVNQTDPTLAQTGYFLGNVRLFYRVARDRLDLTVFARNVTNTVYSVLATGPSNGTTREVYGLPRAFGASLYLHF
jgi:iron complex outermembrane receptor protein